LKNYYLSVDEPPHIIWIFEDNIIPDGCEWIQKDSDSGDRCHYEIKNLKDKEAKRIFNDHGNILNNQTPLKICNNTHPKKLTKSDISLFLHLSG
jgi:hypothetical protein